MRAIEARRSRDIEHTHTLFVNAHFRPLPFGNVAMPMGDFMRDSIAYVGGLPLECVYA